MYPEGYYGASASGIQPMFAQMLDHSLVNFILSQTHSHHLLLASHDAMLMSDPKVISVF